MSFWLWLILTLLIAMSVWCGLRIRAQAQRLERLRKALNEAKLRVHALETDQQRLDSHRENKEDRLRGYLKLMDELINKIPNPIYFKDAQGVFQGCNQVFSRAILGLTRDRIIGRRPQDLPDQIPPELAATYQHQELVMMQKGLSHTFEAEVQCSDGQRRDFLFSLALIQNQDKEAIGSVAVLSDLTEKNRAARDRAQKEKLEGVLETAGGVCHEFNQPLQALSGYLELLSLKIASDEKASDYIAKALEQVERMGSITSKLQGITRYETMSYAAKTKIIDIHKSSE